MIKRFIIQFYFETPYKKTYNLPKMYKILDKKNTLIMRQLLNFVMK